MITLKQFDYGYAEKLASVNADELVNLAAKLGNDVDLPLCYKYQRLNKLRLHLRHKVSNLKKELSCLRSDCKRHDITCH